VPEHQGDGIRSLQKCYSKALKTAVHLMKWRTTKKMGMFTVNMSHDGNCEDNEAETDDMNGENSNTGEPE
jgi:hypothetical protein